jgi:hypothetical protein
MNLNELRNRELHPDDWVWITPAERDALLDVVEAAQQVTKYEPDADWEPGLAQDMPKLVAALSALQEQGQ